MLAGSDSNSMELRNSRAPASVEPEVLEADANPGSSSKGAAERMASRKSKSAPPPMPAGGRRKKGVKAATAQEMSARQRDISVAEFFQKNRHLLGFDNPRKALLTTVKEAVDNSLDACEEAGILPEIEVKIEVAPSSEGGLPPSVAQATRFTVTVTDNGPGIVKKNVGKVFAKLLYGSKFHRLRQSRGQQGIGISAAGMYGQLTTGKPTRVVSKIAKEPKAHCFEVSIDAKKNEPVEHETKQIDWGREQGTSVSITLEGRFQKGKGSVEEYLELTSIANPHAVFVYMAPEGEKREFPRGVDVLPDQPREIKPHPYGIELGMLLKMLQDTKSHWLSGFLSAEFVRVSGKAADEICKAAKLSPRAKPRSIMGKDAEALYKALQTVKLMSPPTDCISPIGEKAILAGLYKEIKGDFYTAVTRSPAVYRGNPFVIEAGIAFGNQGFLKKDPDQDKAEQEELSLDDGDGNGNGDSERPKTLAELRKAARLKEKQAKEEIKGPELSRLIRFANRVPLVYQQTACSTYKAAVEVGWRKYGLTQSRGSLPQGSLVIFVHMASVWVPFTSESKEAIADYDEVRKEIRLALQECGRRLGIHLNKIARAKYEMSRRDKFGLYIKEVAEACGKLKHKYGTVNVEKLKKQLQSVAQKVTGGEKTEAELKRKENAPEELANTIVVTEQGIQGDVPEGMAPGGAAAPEAAAALLEAAEPAEAEAPAKGKGKAKAKKGKAGKAPKPAKPAKPVKAKAKAAPAKAAKGKAGGPPGIDDIPITSFGKQLSGKPAKAAKAKGKKGGSKQKELF